jgi:uncharacterized protein YbjQ (UPF0145 family)
MQIVSLEGAGGVSSTSPMSRYFFHIVNPDASVALDEEGAEFGSYEAAMQEARDSVRELAADALRHGNEIIGIAIQITNAVGKMVGVVDAREIVGRTS